MNEPTNDWSDLARLWQADAAAVPIAEIDAAIARQRRQLRLSMLLDAAGVLLGAAAASWLAIFTPFRWLGLGMLIVAGAMLLARRARRDTAALQNGDLLQSLKESIGREDSVLEQLRYGRALSFVALAAIVLTASLQLRQVGGAGGAMRYGGIAVVLVLGVLGWNLWLARRARVRRGRLEHMQRRLAR